MQRRPLTISEIVGQIKGQLEGEFPEVFIAGEISNLKRSAAGHFYFTLSDSQSSLSGALFRGDALKNPAAASLKDGDQVECTGSIGVYTKRGTFQVIARSLRPKGKGSLKERFEKLKKKLAAEGLFDLEKKRPIPAYPRRLALITSRQGAAIQDFVNIYQRRSLWMDLLVVPATVQGEKGAASVQNGLDLIAQYNRQNPELAVEVVVMTRGGGSLEDLWCFNDESLARAVAAFNVPVISAIGHEVDYSLLDYVADKRCETPSAAAEFVTQAHVQVAEKIQYARRSLARLGVMKSAQAKHDLAAVSPSQLLESLQSFYHRQAARLERCNLEKRGESIFGLAEKNFDLDQAQGRMAAALREKLNKWSYRLDGRWDLLEAYNPHHVLQRGYCYLEDEDGKVVEGRESFLKKSDSQRPFHLHFHDGQCPIVKARPTS